MTDGADLVPLIEGLGRARVLCVGDLMLDRFVYGAVERISPEAPVPVCRVTEETAMLGGVGNVVRNLDALGAAADLVAAVGEDGPAAEIGALVAALARVDAALVAVPARRTTVKTRYFAGAQQLLRADRETTDALDAAAAARLVADATARMEGAGAVVLSDYGKGALTDDTVARLIAAARDAGLPVIVDPKGADFARYRGATLVTPNRRELAEASRMPAGDDDAVIAAARAIMDSCGIGNVLATRSAEGMTLVSADGAVHLPAEAREVFDVSGAGDTVVAAVAAAVAAGASLADAARIANVAAGIVVGKVGTAVAYADDVIGAIHRHDLTEPGERKVLGLDAALDRVRAWRRQGERIGFTNGCFDLIHPGHVALLGQARAACNRLVVGLNADASVRRLKGESRPVQTEAARAAVLAALASVDLVVIFTEDTPVRLIEALRPDLLVKGADYTIDRVVGADMVQSWGGRILLVDLEAGHSTTATIARMNG
ncbi:MAG: D-glycero-beta-D-manno-heptose-7-phosphate kinase [Alphaproteobacteria bacterium]|nr:D-glycero-beta-D-manno-heptose-7-phosphate kinase [Alphaproteobacteria bacterium]